MGLGHALLRLSRFWDYHAAKLTAQYKILTATNTFKKSSPLLINVKQFESTLTLPPVYLESCHITLL